MKNLTTLLSFLIVCISFSATSQCPNSLTGFTLLGEFENSKYFISNGSAAPADAQTVAMQNGGYLASINSQAENDFSPTTYF